MLACGPPVMMDSMGVTTERGSWLTITSQEMDLAVSLLRSAGKSSDEPKNLTQLVPAGSSEGARQGGR
jgi:hypothetical protein